MANSSSGGSREKPILIHDDDDNRYDRVRRPLPLSYVRTTSRRDQNTVSSHELIINLADDNESRDVVEARSTNVWDDAQRRSNCRSRQSLATRSAPMIDSIHRGHLAVAQHEPAKDKVDEAQPDISPARLLQQGATHCAPSQPPVETVGKGSNRTSGQIASNRRNTKLDSQRTNTKVVSSVGSSINSAPTKVRAGDHIITQINERQRARKTVARREETSKGQLRLKKRVEIPRQTARPSRAADASQSQARHSNQLTSKAVPDDSGGQDSVPETAFTMPPQRNQNELDLPALPTQNLTIPTNDFESAQSTLRVCLKRHLAKRYKIQAYATSSMMWRQRTCQESAARNRKEWYALANSYLQHTSPFARMPAISVRFDNDLHDKGFRVISQDMFAGAKSKESWAIRPTAYICDTVKVPPFKEYISLHTNLLADNESKLLATPYFKDETDEGRHKLLEELPLHYEMKHDAKGPLDLRNEQCQFYKQTIDDYFIEVGISWAQILYWLFAPDNVIKQINGMIAGSLEFEAYLLKRSRYGIEEFKRDGETKTTTLFTREDRKCQEIFLELKPATAHELRLSAIICEAVFEECDLNIWYLLYQSVLIQNHVRQKIKTPTAVLRKTYRQTACRVCYQ